MSKPLPAPVGLFTVLIVVDLDQLEPEGAVTITIDGARILSGLDLDATASVDSSDALRVVMDSMRVTADPPGPRRST